MTSGEDRKVLLELTEAVDAGRPVALATVVATRRSVPRHAGTKMLVYDDGRLTGTVGGGELESRVIEVSREALNTGRPQLLEYSLLEPSRGDPGVCGGDVQIYVEPYMPPHTVLVVGCGHIGRAVIDLAHWLGFQVAASDDRAELVTTEELPNADVLLPGSIADGLASHPITEDTSVVMVTRNVDVDVEAIPLLLETPARYVGVMGSERRWTTTRQKLSAAGVNDEALDRIHAPIGLELNAETVEEIAVSILAEVIKTNRSVDPPGD
jgi:xanthine dehydrogenase accessory factor